MARLALHRVRIGLLLVEYRSDVGEAVYLEH